jgi:predicted cupin superfamily sugar epimerase
VTSRPEFAETYDLRPHPEGGWFRETYRSPTVFHPLGYAGPRPSATAILFALHPGERSAVHVVLSDELWLWHAGGELRLRVGEEDVRLGPGAPQALVPGGVGQSAEPAGDEPVLVSCVVSPGFDFADFRLVEPPAAG